jgi:hypothetical protein
MRAAIARPAGAQVVLKLGTLAPQGSTWHEILKVMGQRWAEASGGEVKLRIYPGGVQGNEGDMIRKLGVGQLQAAALSNVGMHDVHSRAEGALHRALLRRRGGSGVRLRARAARARGRPRAARIRRRPRLGALHLFCTEPRRTPADMRRQGLSVVAFDPLPWRNAMGEAQRVLRGDVVQAAFLDGLAAARAACRPAPG